MDISRRTFLIGTIGGAAVLSGVAGERAITWTRRRRADEWADQVQAGLGAHDLGVEYLSRFPTEADRAALIESLTQLVGPTGALLGAERAAESFQEQLRRDYESGDVVDMGGWLLSRTELRLCALGALDLGDAAGIRGLFTPRPLDDGTTVFWTAPAAWCLVPSNLARLEFQLRAAGNKPQRVTIRLGGQLADEIDLIDQSWRSCRYLMRDHDQPSIPLELSTTPPWRPSNDFRTLGAGIDRVVWR